MSNKWYATRCAIPPYRHTAITHLVQAGVDLYTVGGVLGHKSAASTQRYAHLATANLARALGTIGQKAPHTFENDSKKAR